MFLRYLPKFFPIFLFSIALLVSAPISANAASASQVTLNFMCPCGTCDEALSTCECPQSDGFRTQIAGMVGQGYTEDQIIQDFTNRFGPGVLIANAAMAPNAEGSRFDRKTFGFILLMASFALAAFGLGRYMRPVHSPAPPRRRSKNNAKAQASARSSQNAGKKGKKEKGSGKEFDDELLDDYDYK